MARAKRGCWHGWLVARLIADGREEKSSVFIYNLFLCCKRQACSSPCSQATLWKENLIYHEGFFFWREFFVVVYWGKTLQGQK